MSASDDETLAAICIYEPRDPRDVALIEMALAGTGIVYHIDNKGYALASGGPAIGDARMRLLVREDHVEKAQDLLRGALPR